MTPHIDIKRERSNWEGWCVHYAGFMKPGRSIERVTHCEAGVEYKSVEIAIDFTYSRDDGHKYTKHSAHPCFKHEHGLTKGCDKCRFPNAEEIEAHHREADSFHLKVTIAREAILQDLRRRWKTGQTPDHGVTAPADISRFHQPQTNYFCGAGVMDCPVCKTGKLRYSRSTYNGHVHAQCSSDSCVGWME